METRGMREVAYANHIYGRLAKYFLMNYMNNYLMAQDLYQYMLCIT